MHISLDWIAQYVDLSDLSPQRIAHRLTMATAEVEGVKTLVRSLDGVRIGQVVAIEPMGNQLTFVSVACGTEQFTTVCGAPNVKEGMKSAFAPAGVTVAEGQTIAEKQVGGKTSQGILCSSAELGMGGGHFGILDLPESLESGVALADLIPSSDTLLEIDNKSLTHRPDLWGHYGIAREVAAIFERPLHPLQLVDVAQYRDLPAYPLTLDDPENCPCYCCIEITGVAALPAPLALQYRLHALGQRTFNILVDLTNYIMLELGQPMHAFDASRLQAVRVAPFGTTGQFTTLDAQVRNMLPEDLMIWNEREPIALAGIMGGLNSEVSECTTGLLLESANFKDTRIRRTSTRLGVHTDASQRFEKQQPPANTKTATARFLYLLLESGFPLQVRSRLTAQGTLKDQVRYLDIPTDFFDRRIGNPITPDRIVSILTSLGFEARITRNTLSVGIPPFRSEKDIALPVDILEEVTRIQGYDNIEPKMPTFSVERVALNDRLRTQHKARRLLAQAHGFSEIHNYSWFDETWLKTLGYEPEATLEMANPSAEHHARLQTTLLPNILAVVKKNTVLRDHFRIFELGRIYIPVGEQDRIEKNVLAGASYQHERLGNLEEHFRQIKGALEALSEQLNLGTPAFVSATTATAPWHTSGGHAGITLQGTMVGQLGFLSDPLLARIAPSAQVVWFELDFDRLEGPIFPATSYAPTSRYPGSWFDFSIVASAQSGFAELVRTLDEFSHDLLQRREFMALYQGGGLAEGTASYTFRYWIESQDSTLTGEQIEAFRQAYITFLQSRSLRLR